MGDSYLVDPIRAAERAAAGVLGDPADSIRELAHGLASLARQVNALAALSKAAVAEGAQHEGTRTGVWYCPVCGYIDPLTRDTYCPKRHPSHLKRPLFVEAVFGYFLRVGLQEGEEK